MRWISWIVLPPSILAGVVIAVANRGEVLLSIDPFTPATSGYGVTVPLYGVIFAAMFAGMLMGGAAVWVKRRK